MKETCSFVNLKTLIPIATREGFPFLVKNLSEKRIKIYYDVFARDGVTISQRSQSIILNRWMPLCPLTFRGLGIWIGDGLKKYRYGAVNSEPMIIKEFLDFNSNVLGISLNEVKWDLLFSERCERPDVKRVSEKFNLPLPIFVNAYSTPRTKLPTIRIYIQKKVALRLMWILHEKLKPLLLKHKEYAIEYIKGVIATEGSVEIRKKYGTISRIVIACKPKKRREWFIKLLKSLSLTHLTDTKGKIRISGLDNFKIMQRYHLLDLHPSKKEKFVEGLTKFTKPQKLRGLTRLLILKSLSENPKNVKELQKKVEIARQNVYAPLLVMLKEGLIKRVGSGTKNDPYNWLITHKGLKHLQSVTL